MKLSELIQLQPGEDFRFRNNVAVVRWSEFERELIDVDKDGKEFYLNNFNMCFWYRDRQDGEGKIATLHSSHPRPEVLNLPEFIP